MRRWLMLLTCAVIMAAGCAGTETGKPNQNKEPKQNEPGQNKQEKNQTRVPEKKITYGQAHSKYKMNVSYNAQKHKISGTMSVKMTNNLDHTLKKIYFNLWPNATAFKNGGIKVSNVKVNKKKADFQVNQTKLKISGLSIEKGKQATATMHFTVTIPKKHDRFGWYGQTVSLGNWFPILAVYDDEGWNLDPYFGGGESFYSLTGNFDVTFTTDSQEVVAATGKQIGKVKKKDGKATYHFKAENVRDFAMEMNPGYHVKTEEVDGIKVNVYYTDAQKKYADDMLQVGRHSLKLFNKKFGRYAWPELDIAGMKGWFGGMEYPQLVMISFNDEFSEGFIRLSVAHEIGHQWFYGAVGDNEYDAPWLDESFASYMGVMSMGILNRLDGVKPPQHDYYHLTSPVSVFRKHGKEGTKAYSNVIYNYGAKTLNDLRKKLGDETFYKAMHRYYEKKKFKITTTADFIRIMEKASGKDLSRFFKNHYIYLSDE
ncbi:MAG TPA: M1 family metallopeptidase [Bacillales bacterium]|nr:M1 family metallopeptidase [Bacillales bacterium]